MYIKKKKHLLKEFTSNNFEQIKHIMFVQLINYSSNFQVTSHNPSEAFQIFEALFFYEWVFQHVSTLGDNQVICCTFCAIKTFTAQ